MQAAVEGKMAMHKVWPRLSGGGVSTLPLCAGLAAAQVNPSSCAASVSGHICSVICVRNRRLLQSRGAMVLRLAAVGPKPQRVCARLGAPRPSHLRSLRQPRRQRAERRPPVKAQQEAEESSEQQQQRQQQSQLQAEQQQESAAAPPPPPTAASAPPAQRRRGHLPLVLTLGVVTGWWWHTGPVI